MPMLAAVCKRIQWARKDSNLRRQSHQIYSLTPLATWVHARVDCLPAGGRWARRGIEEYRHFFGGFNYRAQRTSIWKSAALGLVLLNTISSRPPGSRSLRNHPVGEPGSGWPVLS